MTGCGKGWLIRRRRKPEIAGSNPAIQTCLDGETAIMPSFYLGVPGSNPGRGTRASMRFHARRDVV
jgi:hypothetical protein